MIFSRRPTVKAAMSFPKRSIINCSYKRVNLIRLSFFTVVAILLWANVGNGTSAPATLFATEAHNETVSLPEVILAQDEFRTIQIGENEYIYNTITPEGVHQMYFNRGKSLSGTNTTQIMHNTSEHGNASTEMIAVSAVVTSALSNISKNIDNDGNSVADDRMPNENLWFRIKDDEQINRNEKINRLPTSMRVPSVLGEFERRSVKSTSPGNMVMKGVPSPISTTTLNVSGTAARSMGQKNLTDRFDVSLVFERERGAKRKLKQTEVELANGERRVSLLGLFELSTRWGLRPEGHSELAAAQMAVRHINQRDDLLSGYTLELLHNDTKCDPGVGVDRFFHALYTQQTIRMVMLLGSACSEVTESLAKVVPYWNIVQVSFGSTSPALSDRREFPLFYRTVAPDSSHNPARIAFIRRFGWDTVATFSQNEEIHSLAVNDLVTELEGANISCTATITFSKSDLKEQLRMLRDLDTRIIIGSFSHDVAPLVFCEAYQLGMYGADYAWILHDTLGPPFWHEDASNCAHKHLAATVENLILVSSHNSIVGSGVSYSGLTNSMFLEELDSLRVPQPISQYAPQTYDAVWAIALALRNAEDQWRREAKQANLDRFDYTRNDMALDFLQHLGRLNFLGVSGPVSFSGADRVGTSAFYQVQAGKLRPIALFYPADQLLDFDCPGCRGIRWKSGQVPIARRVFKLRVATIAPAAFIIITSLASVGICLAIAFLAFNLHFRKLKAIKLSSPKLSNITAVGCIFVYTAVVLLGLDYATLPKTEITFPVVCTARVSLLSAGFTLAFGSMFTKTYRVHRIFTHSGGGGLCRDKMLRDTQLISLVGGLLLLDGLVITLWVLTDPLQRHLSNMTLEISASDRSVVYQPQVEVCRSQHTQSWLGILYTYKGLLLVVGVYMAWETRHVKIPALNDSQYIGVSVYSVVITSAIVVVLANLISERVTVAFLTITTLILISTTATLCLLFFPKINDIWNKGAITDPVIHSMGLKMECNTRRFVTDDRRELQYRVEVQNRVYKKEMAALDAEIIKLEKLLEADSSKSSSVASLSKHLMSELTVINECNQSDKGSGQKPRTPSIGGGLPLLLLSVLPPVIPRASWPSAQPTSNAIRRSVTFSSQPQLDDTTGSGPLRLPAIDLLNLRLTHQQAQESHVGILDKIRGFFGPPSRKPSTTSISCVNGGGTSGIAAALKAHMGLLSGLMPSSGTTSCQTLNTTATTAATSRSLLKSSFARSGTAINFTNIEIIEPLGSMRERRMATAFSVSAMMARQDTLAGNNNNATTNTTCTTTTITTTPNTADAATAATAADADTSETIIETESVESKVNFQLPSQRRPSICHQNSQPTLRERIKGSPRFPHRIVPTSSLNALEERKGSTNFLNTAANRRLSSQQITTKLKWKSMEESTFFAQNPPAPVQGPIISPPNSNLVESQ